MKLETMTVRAKLSWAFGGLAAIVLAVSGLAVKSLGEANDRHEEFVKGINARLLQSHQVRSAIYRAAVAVRNLALAATPPERDAERLAGAQAQEQVQQRMDALMKMALEPGVSEDAKRLITELDKVQKAYSPLASSVVGLLLGGKRDEALDKMSREVRPLLAALERAAQAYQEFTAKRSEQMIAQAAADYATQRNLLLAGCLLAFAAAGGTGLLITRSLTRALGAEPAELGAVAQRVAAGDLSPVAAASSAPDGSVLASLGLMQNNLAGIVGQVRGSSESIATASAQIATGNSDLSQRTEEQASSLEQTAASMEQLAGTVKTSAETAAEANRLAAGASDAAVKGGELVGQVVATMQDISAASKRIADIIGVIDGIAFQTNILALNAAVEAARAGQQGRGFAVVASEVRSLAGRSAEAAREIKRLIGASVEKVEAGARQVDEAGASMGEIVSQVQRVSQMIGELSNASSEQSQGIGQVSEAVQQLDQVTQQNAALVEQTAAAADSLRLQAGQLSETMARFKLDGVEAARRTAQVLERAAQGSAAHGAARPATASAGTRTVRKAAPAARAPAAQPRAEALAQAASEEWTTF